MTAFTRSLIAAALLLATMPIQPAQAGAGRLLAREPMPTKSETCKPRWPYVVITCVG